MSAMAAGLVVLVLVTLAIYALWRLITRPSSSGPTDGRSPARTHGVDDRRVAWRDLDNDQRRRWGKL